MTWSRLGQSSHAALLLGAAVLAGSCSSPRPPATRLPMELLGTHSRKPRAAETTGTIVGVVLRDNGAPVDGALIAAVNVMDDPEEGKLPLLSTSLGRGKFELQNVPPGNYGLTVMAPIASRARPSPDDPGGAVLDTATYAGVVTVTPGEAGPPMLVRLGTKGILLHGQVHDENGGPVAEGLVRAVRESPFEGDHFFAKTNAKGEFALMVPSATYFLVGQATGRKAVRPDFTIDAGRPPADMTIVLPPALVPPGKDDLGGWISASGSVLASVDGIETADLEPLRKLVGSARIVGLGEASYTGAETARLKQRMFQFMVEKMGVSVLLLEAGQADARALDEHVLSGKGRLSDVLKQLGYYSLDTEEAASLFTWMRVYNESKKHRTKLRVVGVDVQRTGTAAGNLRLFLEKVDRTFAPTMESTLDRLRSNELGAELKKRPQDEQAHLVRDLEALVERIDANKAKYSGRSSAAAYAEARADSRALVWGARVYGNESLRGAAMADLAKRAIDAAPKKARVVLWTHNAQVSKRKLDGGMGAVLAEAYEADYVSVGFTFYQGWVRAWDFTTGPTTDRGTKLFRLGPADNGTLEAVLESAGVAMFMADVRGAPPAIAPWFEARLSLRNVGTVFVNERRSRTRTVVKEAFDGLVFVKKLTTVKLTESGKRPGKAEWQ